MGTPIITKLKNSATITEIWNNFVGPFYKSGSIGSFGRLWSSLLIAFCLGRYWSVKLDPPESLITVLLAFLGYVFLTKGAEIYRDKTSTKVTAAPGSTNAGITTTDAGADPSV